MMLKVVASAGTCYTFRQGGGGCSRLPTVWSGPKRRMKHTEHPDALGSTFCAASSRYTRHALVVLRYNTAHLAQTIIYLIYLSTRDCLVPPLPLSEVVRDLCTKQIPPRIRHELGRAASTAPTRQHDELDHTDHSDRLPQNISICKVGTICLFSPKCAMLISIRKRHEFFFLLFRDRLRFGGLNQKYLRRAEKIISHVGTDSMRWFEKRKPDFKQTLGPKPQRCGKLLGSL